MELKESYQRIFRRSITFALTVSIVISTGRTIVGASSGISHRLRLDQNSALQTDWYKKAIAAAKSVKGSQNSASAPQNEEKKKPRHIPDTVDTIESLEQYIRESDLGFWTSLKEEAVADSQKHKHNPKRFPEISFKSTGKGNKESRGDVSETEIAKELDLLYGKEDPEATMPWVEKYRPKNSTDLVGNVDTVVKFREWLKGWISEDGTPQRPKAKKGRQFNACMLSGIPGIGKTAMAHIVPKELGFFVFELNASEDRSRGKLKQFLEDALSTEAIEGKKGLVARCILMDEVDGMHGSENSGGVQYLMQMIKKTHIPVICTCNDRFSKKISGLVKVCLDLRLRKPDKTQIASRLKTIAMAESLNITQEALELVSENARNDIRMSVNLLMGLQGFQGMIIDAEVIRSEMGSMKELMLKFLSANECIDLIFQGNSSGLTLQQRIDLVYNDYELIPELAIKNFGKAILGSDRPEDTKQRQISACQKFEKDIIYYKKVILDPDPDWYENGDGLRLINGRLPGRDYSYLQPISYATVLIGEIVSLPLPFPDRPTRLYEEARKKKRTQYLRELMVRLSAFPRYDPELRAANLEEGSDSYFINILRNTNPYGTDEEDLRKLFLPKLREELLEPLLMEEQDAARNVAERLVDLNLEPRHLLVHMRDLQLRRESQDDEEDIYALLSDEMKSNLLKEYKLLSPKLSSDSADDDGIVKVSKRKSISTSATTATKRKAFTKGYMKSSTAGNNKHFNNANTNVHKSMESLSPAEINALKVAGVIGKDSTPVASKPKRQSKAVEERMQIKKELEAMDMEGKMENEG